MKKKNPCPSCCHNLKVFQAKAKSLEARALQSEKSRDSFQLKNAEIFDETRRLSYENMELKAQVRELSWRSTQLGSLVSQVYAPVPQ